MVARKRIHICHVQTTFRPGGLENGVANVVNGLDPDRFRSTVVCLHDRGALADRVTNPMAEVINLAHPDRLAPELPFRLAKLFRELEPDIVHCRNYTANLYGTLGAHLARVPVVVNGEHGQVQLVHWKKKLVSRTLALFADKILCVSPGLRDYLYTRLRYPANSVHTIINGVPLERFDAMEVDGMAKRRELGIPEDVWLLGTVSRFYPFKDHPAMLDFLEAVPEVDGRPVHAVIVGVGDTMEEFIADRDRRGLQDRMHLPGFRKDVHELYSMFDLFCLLSTDNEGTSNAILESMAAGAPILTTDIQGNKHLIRDGWNGVLVPPRGSSKRAAMKLLIPPLLADATRRAEMSANGGRYVRENFRLQRMVNDYAAFYGGLAG